MAKKTSAKSTTAKNSKKSAAKTSGKKATKAGSSVTAKLGQLVEVIESYLPVKAGDIVTAIKEDHKGLRNYLGLLKDTDKPMNERRQAYKSFSELLKSHTIAEEKVVYAQADELTGKELHIKIAEGYVEHQVADDLMKRIEASRDPMEWSAHCNVLSEIVEHHLKEEERDLLPLIRRKAKPTMNMEMLADYMALRAKTQKRPSGKNAGALK